jgi:hypothetical protein
MKLPDRPMEEGLQTECDALVFVSHLHAGRRQLAARIRRSDKKRADWIFAHFIR